MSRHHTTTTKGRPVAYGYEANALNAEYFLQEDYAEGETPEDPGEQATGGMRRNLSTSPFMGETRVSRGEILTILSEECEGVPEEHIQGIAADLPI